MAISGGNFPVPNSGFDLDRTSFKLNLNQVQKIIQAGDGWVDTDGDGWGNRSANEWGTAFDNDLNLIGKVAGEQNGGLDFLEKKYLATQFNYDAMEQPRGEWLDRAVNGNPISGALAEEADHFVESLFWNETNSSGITGSASIGQLRYGLDINSNGVFDMEDATTVAAYDGDTSTLSDVDFEQAALSGQDWSPEQLGIIQQIKGLDPTTAGQSAIQFGQQTLQEFGLDPGSAMNNQLGQPFLRPIVDLGFMAPTVPNDPFTPLVQRGILQQVGLPPRQQPVANQQAMTQLPFLQIPPPVSASNFTVNRAIEPESARAQNAQDVYAQLAGILAALQQLPILLSMLGIQTPPPPRR